MERLEASHSSTRASRRFEESRGSCVGSSHNTPNMIDAGSCHRGSTQRRPTDNGASHSAHHQNLYAAHESVGRKLVISDEIGVRFQSIVTGRYVF